MSLLPMLDWWQWLVLAATPPAIVLLYFLKLKRQPLEVPSTYLWTRSIEDLHVNSIWQRLRQSLLLLLQILLVLLVMLALLRPNWQGTKLSGHRFVFLIDNSASMSAADVKPSRLEEAKRRVGELIDQMASGDTAMIVSFADSARVEQPFTENRRNLHRRLAAVAPTERATSLAEALRLAAGHISSGRATDDESDHSPSSQPTTAYIFSDGKFPNVEGFSLGSLKPEFVPIGEAKAKNVGITAFSTRRPEGQASKLQAFARLENSGQEDVTAEVSLFIDGTLADADEVKLKAKESGSVVFELAEMHDGGVLRLTVSPGGDLAVDDEAWLAVNPPRRAKVLLVSAGDEALEFALSTDRAGELAEITLARPDILDTKAHQEQAAGGALDLIIYDACQPKVMPQANTLFIGRIPPGKVWGAKPRVGGPQVIDVNGAHPLTQLLDLGNVNFAEGLPLMPPAGSTTLIDTDSGIMFAIGTREGFEDAVLGLEIVGTGDKGEKYANTDWPLRLSFPVFVLGVLEYLGGSRESLSVTGAQPGQSVLLHSGGQAEKLEVVTPRGERVEVRRGAQSTFAFHQTDELGVYLVREGGKAQQRFAINLFDSAESNITPRDTRKPEEQIKIGYVEVSSQGQNETSRREAWKWLLAAALAVLLLEWYIYNRRVYL